MLQHKWKLADLRIKFPPHPSGIAYCLGIGRAQEVRICYSGPAMTVRKFEEITEWRVDEQLSFKSPVELDFDSFPAEAVAVSACFYSDSTYQWEMPQLRFATDAHRPSAAFANIGKLFVYDKNPTDACFY